MTSEAIYWLLLTGVASWCGGLTWWVVHHHSSCHSAPLAAASALAQRVQAQEEESDRLARNAHDDRDVIGACALDVAIILKHLGMPHHEQTDIPKKLRKLAAELERKSERR